MNTHLHAFSHVPTLSELTASFPGIRGLFFDMDGTLFNTEAHHTEAFLRFGKKYGIRPPFSPDAVYNLLVGRADHLVYEVIKSWEGFPKDFKAHDFVAEKTRYLLEIIAAVDPKTYFPEATQKLLAQAKAQGLFLALVTSSEKIITQELLRISGAKAFFELVVTRDDCPVHKPDPFPYRHALELSGLRPNEVVVFEDSKVGLEAACGSGAHVVKAEWF